MKLVGRIDEKNILNKCLKSNKPEFVVIYGRRRVGKTYLIKNFLMKIFPFTQRELIIKVTKYN